MGNVTRGWKLSALCAQWSLYLWHLQYQELPCPGWGRRGEAPQSLPWCPLAPHGEQDTFSVSARALGHRLARLGSCWCSLLREGAVVLVYPKIGVPVTSGPGGLRSHPRDLCVPQRCWPGVTHWGLNLAGRNLVGRDLMGEWIFISPEWLMNRRQLNTTICGGGQEGVCPCPRSVLRADNENIHCTTPG